MKLCRNLRGAFTLSLDCDGSEAVNFNSVVVDRYIVSLDMTDRVAAGKWFCAGLILLNASLGVSSHAVSTLQMGFSSPDRLDSVESVRVVWSVSPAWEAVELTLGDCLHLPVRGPRPYRFGTENRGCTF